MATSIQTSVLGSIALASYCLTLMKSAAAKLPRLRYLDRSANTPEFSYLMSSLSGGLSDKQGAIVPYLLKLLKRIPGASLETLRLLVDEKVKGAYSPNSQASSQVCQR